MPDQAGSSRRVTIRDVAARAGVSIGTASKALNGKGKLRADTRRHRIEQRPSMSAGLGIPVIYAMTQSLDHNEPAVIPDDFGGGRAAAAHLLAAGCRRLAHITGPDHFLAARKRANGFCQEAAAAGAEIPPGDVLYGEWSEQWGREAAGIIAASAPDLDGLFCGNDQIARGASEMLRQLGRAIPADVAVVGFDNWEPVVLGADPPLTSVDMCLEDIGRKAAELLLDAVAGQQRSGLHTLPCRLVPRDSSGLGQR